MGGGGGYAIVAEIDLVGWETMEKSDIHCGDVEIGGLWKGV